MARPKSFDPVAARDGAIDAFWVGGYEATSVEDLSDRLGITWPALYREWRSKDGLYQQALAEYRRVAGSHFVEALATDPDDVVEIVRRRLLEIVDEAVTSPDQRGCFLVNAICERSSSDEATRRQADEALRRLEERLSDALHTAIRHGALSHSDPDALARFVVVVIMGLRVVGKARPTREALAGVVEQAMRVAI